METLTAGKLAKEASVNIETLRFYERRGLMPEPVRRKSGYRQYSQKDVARLQFIKRAVERPARNACCSSGSLVMLRHLSSSILAVL